MWQSIGGYHHNNMSKEDYRDILDKNRFEIVECLNLERTLLLNYLRDNHVFDEEDCELIMAEKANRGKAGKLIDFLVKKGPEAYQPFLDVIQVENPTLYESLTGVKATSQPSPLMKKITGYHIKGEEGSNFSMQIMAEHLHRTYGDLQDISVKYANILKTKNDLEEKLLKAESNLEFEKKRRSEYEEREIKINELYNEDDETRKVLLFNECDNLQKGIADRDVYIIVLQMKLLAEKEESERLKCKLKNEECKNENISRDLRRVSDKFNQERNESLKLSQCIRSQANEIHKLELLRREVREAKYENILMRGERDNIAEELEELKQWAEALKVRFDAEVEEKNKVMEKNDNFSNLQERVRYLERKLALSEVEIEDGKKRNERLAKDIEIYKKQRECASVGRKEAIMERNNAISEKDCLQMQYNELQNKRDKFDEERASFLHEYDALDKRYKTVLEELAIIKRKLNEKEMEAEDLNTLLTEAEEKNRSNSHLFEVVPPKSEFVRRDEGSSVSDDEPKQEIGEGNVAQNNLWEERRLDSLIRSMKHRIFGEQSEDNITADQNSPVSSTMTWKVMQCLLPHLTKRPAANVTQTLNFHALERKLVDNKVEEKKTEAKSSTLGFKKQYFCNPRRVNNVRGNADSTRTVCDDDEIPTFFRPRLA